MKSKLILIVGLALCFLFCFGATAYASGEEVDCDELGLSETTEFRYHAHCYDDKDTHAKRDDPIGVGADVLLVEGKKIDLVAEYKYDFENEEHSVFGVFKTKVALWDIIKGIFNRGE